MTFCESNTVEQMILDAVTGDAALKPPFAGDTLRPGWGKFI